MDNNAEAASNVGLQCLRLRAARLGQGLCELNRSGYRSICSPEAPLNQTIATDIETIECPSVAAKRNSELMWSADSLREPAKEFAEASTF